MNHSSVLINKRPSRRSKRSTVSLTSLLDLLFVMIFVSLMQQKTQQSKRESQPKTVEKKVVVAKEQKQQTTEAKAESPYYSIQAVFEFYATAKNPMVQRGKYLMQGVFESQSSKLSLGGIEWQIRPENYDMVPLSGFIDESRTQFRGRIEFDGCEVFTLKKLEAGQKNEQNPIVGTWKGTYNCSQGETGLTLTIR